jgi:flagella basal body P-ring formation protein FlgA
MKSATLIILLLSLCSYTLLSHASQIQSITSIKEAIDSFIASNLAKNTDYKIRHSHLDKRLKLSLCSEALDIFSHIGSIKAGRNSIGVKCNGDKKWTIYSSVNISIYKEVIVLTQPVRRGDIFSNSLFHQEKREISTLRSGFFTTPNPIINKQATRNLSAGTVITQTNFVEAKLIQRGEKVYITTNSPNLAISMAGIAMMDGVKGQNIRVKNLKTQQIVLGTVIKPGQVTVLF